MKSLKFVLAAGILMFGICGAMALALSTNLSVAETLAILIAAALLSITLYLLVLLYF